MPPEISRVGINVYGLTILSKALTGFLERFIVLNGGWLFLAGPPAPK